MAKSIDDLQAELAALSKPQKQQRKDSQPTKDFVDDLIWWTWRYGPHKGAGEFEAWAATEGKRLTRLHDERLQQNLANDDSESALLRWYWTEMLSWNFSKTGTPHILAEDGRTTGLMY